MKISLKTGEAVYLPLFLAALVVCSIFIISFHHHANLEEYTNCVICKIAHDLSSGGKAPPALFIVPEAVKKVFVFETTKLISENFIFSKSSRSPPL